MNRSVLRGIGIIIVAAIIIVVMFVLPSPKVEQEHAENANLDPWVLVSNDPDTAYGTYLGNGFISTRVLGDGVGSQNGKPLSCFMAGLYENEKLRPIPTWSDFRLYDGKYEFKIDKEEPYSQVLNMKTGVFATKATWKCGGKTLDGAILVLVSRDMPNIGMVMGLFTPNFDGDITVSNPVGNLSSHGVLMPDAECGALSASVPIKNSKRQLGIAMCISTDAKALSAADPPGRAGISRAFRVKRDVEFSVRSYASLAAASDLDTAEKKAVSALRSAVALKMDIIKRHKAAWEKLWEKDIIIDGPPKDQQAIHSCMFYLLESVREGSPWSIPPMGLSSNLFSGHVFWDADTWMFPALILQHPELARSIVEYRYMTLPGAMANAKRDGYAGAAYAWESGASGIEDIPPGLVYKEERHIDGDVALAQWQYYLATGDRNWLKDRGFPVIKATADYWVSRVTFNKEKDRYEIRQVVPPDENAELVDNSVYTNAVAQMNLRIAIRAARIAGSAPNPKWSQIADKMYIPFDAVKKRFIAYDGFRSERGCKGFSAKQADTELLVYPLQFNLTPSPPIGRERDGVRGGNPDLFQIYKNTYDFYAPKVMPNGPAMSNSAHSVIAARLGDCSTAYDKFLASYKPYFREPFNYFNEKKSTTMDNTCFLTGAAGPVQASIFGMAGVVMDYFPADDKKVGLTYSPCLPKKWKSIKITGIQWRGDTFDLIVQQGKSYRVEKSRG